jgi:hypothetical protein
LNRDEGLVEVYRARTAMEAEVIKGLLDGFDIPCMLTSNAAPSVHIFTMDGMGEVRVMVPAALAKAAEELIVKE